MKKLTAILLTAALIFSLCGTALAEGEATGFTDVSADAWYAEAVAWCRDNEIMNGTSDTTFEPDMILNRAMLATILHRAEKEPPVTGTADFTDTEPGAWYSEAVVWANSTGLMLGYGDGTFGPADSLTREQLATVLWRYDGEKEAESVELPHGASIHDFARTAVDWAVANNILRLREDGSAAPLEFAARAEAAWALYACLTGASDPEPGASADKPVVYMTTDISSDGLMAIYDALGASPEGSVAVKLSTGEPGSNYLRTNLIGALVESLDATIVECNTAYGGSRSNTAMHKQLAADHGYTQIADVDIMDEEGDIALAVTGGDNLTENYVGSHFPNYDYFVVLSHFKGHAMAGFGGAVKNISIGIASSRGKSHIHSGGTGGSMWGGDQDAFLESMAEAGKSVADALDGNILYINVMNRLSVDCDCDSNPAEPDMYDIGILASFDPVAVDQACVDLVYEAEDGGSLVRRIESRNGLHTLEQAEKIGLGSREYELVSID